MNITVRQLQAFLAVAEHGSFTRAAERLYVTQSAVSVLLRELERELGIRLLDRTTRRVELTEGGREFRLHADKLLADLDLAVQNAQERAARRRGRIAVAAPPLLAAVLLPGVIAAFNRAYPGIRVSLIDGRTDEIVASVRSGAAHVAVGTFAADPATLGRRPLVADTLHLFCPAGHRLAAAPPAWRDLAGEPLVALTRDSGIRSLIDWTFDGLGLAPEPAYEVSQITTAMALVEAGLGVAVLPTYALAIARGRPIAALPLTAPEVTREVAVIWPLGRSLPPGAEEFIEILAAEARVPA